MKPHQQMYCRGTFPTHAIAEKREDEPAFIQPQHRSSLGSSGLPARAALLGAFDCESQTADAISLHKAARSFTDEKCYITTRPLSHPTKLTKFLNILYYTVRVSKYRCYNEGVLDAWGLLHVLTWGVFEIV